jgi:DNA-dependent RNA polymerase auxiliary subunit epsilon
MFCCFKNKPKTTDMCDCLVYVEIADIKAARKCVETNKYYVLFISAVYRNCVDTNKDYSNFLSFVVGVNNFHPLNYCYFNFYYYCCYWISFVLCFPFALLSVFASYTSHQSTPQLYCHKPVTHYTYCLLNCANVCNSAVSNFCPSY